MNCCVAPFWIEGLAGVTAIELSEGLAAVTVTVLEPLIPPETARIVEEPAARLVARPEFEMVATELFEELQVTEVVMFCVLASEKVPVAVNC